MARRKAEGYVPEVSFGGGRCYLGCEVCGDQLIPVLLGAGRTLVIVMAWVRTAPGILLASSLRFRTRAGCIGLLVCPSYWRFCKVTVKSVEKYEKGKWRYESRCLVSCEW